MQVVSIPIQVWIGGFEHQLTPAVEHLEVDRGDKTEGEGGEQVVLVVSIRREGIRQQVARTVVHTNQVAACTFIAQLIHRSNRVTARNTQFGAVGEYQGIRRVDGTHQGIGSYGISVVEIHFIPRQIGCFGAGLGRTIPGNGVDLEVAIGTIDWSVTNCRYLDRRWTGRHIVLWSATLLLGVIDQRADNIHNAVGTQSPDFVAIFGAIDQVAIGIPIGGHGRN